MSYCLQEVQLRVLQRHYSNFLVSDSCTSKVADPAVNIISCRWHKLSRYLKGFHPDFHLDVVQFCFYILSRFLIS